MLFRIPLAFAALLCALHLPPAFAAESSANSDKDEYDFSWLDPEKKIYVVQNRKYTKAGRLEASLSAGIGMGETYRTQRQLRARGTYYLNEHWGISAFYFANTNTENDTMTALRSVSNVIPAVRDTNAYFGASAMWIPFYGKINLFNQVFYIDWHFELGLGSAGTEVDINTRANGSAVIETASFGAFHWGSGWKFFITRSWSARFDFLATYYKAPNALRGSVTNSEEERYDNYYLTLGVGFTL